MYPRTADAKIEEIKSGIKLTQDAISNTLRELQKQDGLFGYYWWLHKKLGFFSTVFSVFAKIIVAAVPLLPLLWSVLPASLEGIKTLAVAIANSVAGGLWGLSALFSRKKQLTKRELNEKLIIEQEKLQTQKSEQTALENKRYIHEWCQDIIAQQEQLSKLRPGLTLNSNAVDATLLERKLLAAPSQTSEITLLKDKLQQAEKKIGEDKEKFVQTIQYKIAQQKWGILAPLFYTAAAVAVIIAGPLAVAAFSLVGSSFSAAFFYRSKKESANKLKLKAQVSENIAVMADLREQINQQVLDQKVKILKGIMLKQQEKIRKLLSADGKQPQTLDCFKKIDELNAYIQTLEKEKNDIKSRNMQSRESIYRQDTNYRSKQKILRGISGAFCVLAAASVIVGLVFPPFGLATIAGIGASFVATVVCSVCSSLASIISAVYYDRKIKAIKEQLRNIEQQEQPSLDQISELKKQKKQEIIAQVQCAIVAQKQEITGLSIQLGAKRELEHAEASKTVKPLEESALVTSSAQARSGKGFWSVPKKVCEFLDSLAGYHKKS